MRLQHAVSLLTLASSLLVFSDARLFAQTTACSPGALEVREVTFIGNASIPASTLEAVIETTPSSAVRRLTRIVGARHCLQEGALLRDVARLMLFYRRKGFPGVAVDTNVARTGPEAIHVGFVVHENAPILVDSVEIRGVTDSALHTLLQPAIQLRVGNPLDRFALDASSAGMLPRLRRVGYLIATARVGDQIDSTARRAVVWIGVTTGPRIRLGNVRVEARGVDDGDPRFHADRVRRLTGLEPGRVLGSQELAEARRRLDNAGLFDEVRIGLDSIRGAEDGDTASDATVDVSVSTIEGLANQVRLRAGYATLDCYRVQLQGRRSGVLRPSGSFELTMNLSKIAVGSPLDFAPSMCSSAVREDPYSTRLNYYVGGTYAVAGLGRRGVTRSLSVYAERRSEYLAYLKTTYIGGSASLARSLGRRWGATVAYDLSYSRTEAEPAVLCATFSACLAADREQFTEALPFGLLSLSTSYDGTDIPADPTRGRSLRVEFRIAPSWLGTASREQVFGGRLSASAYLSLSKRTVLAARLTGGFVNSLPGGDFIPQGERLFAGGASSVRGFRQNEVGSSVYIVDSVRTVVQGADTLLWAFPPDSNESRAVPTGGNTAAVGNIELRVRPPVFTELVQFVAFVDAGVVWNRGEQQLSETQIVFTPGIGARLSTFIGPIRLDIASNRYAPPKGPAYRDVSLGLETAPLYCVSIGNTLPVTGFGQTDSQGRPIPPVQAEGPCPATFAPTRATSFWDRLTINFSIGHAF